MPDEPPDQPRATDDDGEARGASIDEGFASLARGEVNWGWGAYELGDEPSGGKRRRSKALARIPRRDLALRDDAWRLSFPRPRWQLGLGLGLAAIMAVSIGLAVAALGDVGNIVVGAGYLWLAWFGARATLYRIRASWDDDDLVIASWPQRRGRRLPRADVAEVHRRDDALVVRTRDDAALPLVVGRQVTARDAVRARELAAELGVPYVDDTAEVLPLPEARIREKG